MKNLIIISCMASLLSSCVEETKAPDAGGIDLNTDLALRGHLDVNALVGGIRAPEDAVAYVVTTLEYENGELLYQGHATTWDIDPETTPYVSAQLLWGEVKGEPRVSLTLGGSVSRHKGDFWAKVGSGSAWWGHDVLHDEYAGYQILGMSWSEEARDGHEKTGVGSDMEAAIKKRRHVGALVVKFFQSKQEAVDHVHAIWKQNDERRKAAPGSG